jgi:DNA-binding LacI/PurR family transcriptional regulator/DNA-binding transcriptional regulator YhcF (GntR family)
VPTIDKKLPLRAIGEMPVPLYRLLEQKLRQKIGSGQWKPGMMIPGRQRLSKEYDVHVRTVERAVRALIDEGTLETQGTRGTFVAAELQASHQEPPMSHEVAERGAIYGGGQPRRLDATTLIGIITSDNPLSRDTETIINSIEKAFSAEGGSAIFHDRIVDQAIPGSKTGRIASVVESINALRDRACSAVIAIDYNEPEPMIDQIDALAKDAALPLVHILSTKANVPAWAVYYDSFDAAYRATQHLIERSCADYLFIASMHFTWAEERLAGVRAALRRAQIPEANLRIRFVDYDDRSDPRYIDAARQLALAAFADGVPAGIVAVNDNVAIGVMKAAEQLNLVAGKDFLLVGFDDNPEARSYNLSTMRPPLEELGQSAVRLARRAMGNDPTVQQVCLSSHLLMRLSTLGTVASPKTREPVAYAPATAVT